METDNNEPSVLGVDREKDQAIELSFRAVKGLKEGERTYRFRPTVPIKKKAFETHGISGQDLAEEPRFQELAGRLWTTFSDAEVFVGFNVDFDTDILRRQFFEAGFPDPFESKTIVCPYNYQLQMEPRTLEATHERFIGKKLKGAHAAANDVSATFEVLEAMKKHYGHEDKDLFEISDLCFPDKKFWIGPTKHLKWDDGRVTLNFGKHSEDALYDLNGAGWGFLKWMLGKDFPPHVKQIVSRFLENEPEEQFNVWVDEQFTGQRYAEEVLRES